MALAEACSPVQHSFNFTADVTEHGVLASDLETLGRVAYCIGPFTAQPVVYRLDPDASKPLLLGRAPDCGSVRNNAIFQDYSVAEHSASITFDRSSCTYVLKCSDPSGVLISDFPAGDASTTTDGNRFRHVQAGETCPVPLCSAVRLGLHSWVSFMPFCPAVIMLVGTYNGDQKISVRLCKQTTTIGSASSLSDVYVPAFEVSQVHCKIVRTPSGFVLSDMNSTTGTFVNGIRVLPPVGMFLFPGAQISLGDPGLGSERAKQGLELVVLVNGREKASSSACDTAGVNVGGDRNCKSPLQRDLEC